MGIQEELEGLVNSFGWFGKAAVGAFAIVALAGIYAWRLHGFGETWTSAVVTSLLYLCGVFVLAGLIALIQRVLKWWRDLP